MPELPEVEFCARYLRRHLLNRRIDTVWASEGRPLIKIGLDELVRGLVNNTVLSIRRHGKQLFIDLSGGQSLWVHLGMTGKWVARGPGKDRRKWSRMTLGLDDGCTLDYVDPRKFGRILLKPIHGPDADAEATATGPDALVACQTPGELAQVLKGTKRAIKVALLDQKRIAGVGNIYAAEALFLAGIGPEIPASSLTYTQYECLSETLLRVMVDSLERETGSEIDYINLGGSNPFLVYGREGAPCPTCKTPIQRITQAARSTFLCPNCQAATA